MNNDLEQFSEERLMQITQQPDSSTIFMYEVRRLARIALSVKQAKPVALVVIDKHTDEVMLDISDEGRDLQAGDALYTTPQPAHREQNGWKLVPIEPTEEMVINGFESEPDETFSPDEEWESYDAMSGCEQAAHRAKLCWQAMLAAAPKPESD